MYTLATTRFTNNTWIENKNWREKNDWKGCIYGSPLKIGDKISSDSIVFILEMNNDENKIKGIGLIKKTLFADKYYKIYSDMNYNRYIYKSLYRIDVEELNEYEKSIIDIFNILLFKGLRNVKRYQGITAIPKWIADNKHMDFIKFFRELFISKFKSKEGSVAKRAPLQC
jgi:hypothetical protein